MKTIIHVNQHHIKKNRGLDNGDTLPVLTVKTYNSNRYAHAAKIIDSDGRELAKIVYRPHAPLSCGAHCWIETQCEVEVSGDPEA